jgi:hypothetical protein
LSTCTYLYIYSPWAAQAAPEPTCRKHIPWKKYSIYIHQLVATLFIKNPNNYPFVNHIDENRENNCIFNLEWITNKQNITHSQGKGVSQYTLDDIFIKNYNSVNDAFRELNKVYGANIKLVCEGKRKTAFGYKWKWI